MKVTAVFAIRQRIVLSLIAMLMILPARAGGPLYMPFLVKNDPSTTTDDQMKPIALHWNSHMKPVQFYYAAYQPGDVILYPAVLYSKESERPQRVEILRAFNAAVKTWNNARFSNFKFADNVISLMYAPPIPMTNPPIYPGGLMLDGYNVISFIDEMSWGTGDLIGFASMVYFNQDFDPASQAAGQWGFPEWVIDSAVYGATNATLWILDFNGDGLLDVNIPYTKYKAGEFIDVDISVNPAITQDLRAWPEDYSDIPVADRVDVIGSLDIQMIITHQLGFAAGLGGSNIQSSAMNPYFEPPTSFYPTDPYERRKLAFDDELNAGVAHGSFPSNSSSISGRVLEGALVDANPDNDAGLNLYVAQQMIYLSVRPEQLDNCSWLNCGWNVNPNFAHPDNVVSSPILPDSNQGTWRLIAEVVNGNNLLLPVGPADDIFFALAYDGQQNSQTGTAAGGNPIYNEDTSLITDPLAMLEEGQWSSDYQFPGLTATDDTGTTINYAVSLGKVVPATGDGGAAATSTVGINGIQELVGLAYAVTPEFYGGDGTQIPVGDGTAVDENILQDNLFENEFVTCEVDQAGRIAASINGGPSFLSGFNAGPRSYFTVQTPQGLYSNREGLIGLPQDAMVIDDLANSATGSWSRSGAFSIRQQISIATLGGASGTPTEIRVSYNLTNTSDQRSSFTLRQVLDAVQFGLENPLFVNNFVPIYNEHTFKGADVPTQLEYQTSLNNPTFSSYISLRGASLITPDEVTVAKLSNLNKSFSSDGAVIGGSDAVGVDTGAALVWKGITLGPAESKQVSFTIGYYTPGTMEDGYADVEVDETTGLITLGNDDPGHVTTIQLSVGENRDNCDIITNTGTDDGDVNVTPTDPDTASGNALSFVPAANAFPNTDYITMSGAVGDIDNDGDLDVVTAGYGGGADPVSGRVDRIYLNEQRIEADGSVTYFFRDVTYGTDGLIGTMDDRLKALEPSSDGKGTVPVAAPSDTTVGVVLADFNNDGYLDVFFTNGNGIDNTTVRGYDNRFYLNEGASNPGSFIDKSKEWLPGYLNFGWGKVFDMPNRATAGDIDSDGDNDIIISEIQPMWDPYLTCAWVDVSPAGNLNNPHYALGDNRPNMVSDQFSEQLELCERVLVNQVNHPPYSLSPQGEFFIDETLGSDDRFGTLTSLQCTIEDPLMGVQIINAWQPSELDRMAPVYPMLKQFPETGPTQLIDSPMANRASEPRLGPLESHGGLDLVSMRPFGPDIAIIPMDFLAYPDTIPNPQQPPETILIGTYFNTYSHTSAHGSDQAFFRNLDLFTLDPNGNAMYSGQYRSMGADGIPDGYFGCMNYGDDYYWPRFNGELPGLVNQFDVVLTEDGDVITSMTVDCSAGLFAFTMGSVETTSGTMPAFIYDANPLFIGLPDGSSGDVTPDDPVQWETDGVPAGSLAWTGVVADFTNHGSGDVFMGTDDDVPYTVFYSGHFNAYNDWGCSRFNSYAGIGYLFDVDIPWPYYMPMFWANDIQMPPPPPVEGEEVHYGEAYGTTAADFDHDGDMDVFVATTTFPGISAVNTGLYLLGIPMPDRLYLNDSFGGFVDDTGAVMGAGATVTMDTIHADIDNDGDEDLLVFNGLAPNQLLLNQSYTDPPDTNNQTDAKMFFDNSIEMIPPIMIPAIYPPMTYVGIPVGITVRANFADMNSDGRPDLLKACGGHFTAEGDFDQVLLNTGKPQHGGIRTFKPYNSAYPTPAITNWRTGGLSRIVYGMIDTQSFNNDIAAGDVDNDGDNDMVLVRQERAGKNEAPALYINEDVNELPLNSVPDSDQLGDAFFEPAVPGFWPQIFTPGTSATGTNLKRQGQRVLMADFDKNGRLDVAIANGRLDNGAPNVLLLNKPIGTQAYYFIDATETNFPLDSGGVMGVRDNTNDMAVGDFDSDGDVDIIFANQTTDAAPMGFRFLVNDGRAVFADDDPSFAASDSLRRIPNFLGKVPRGIVAADFDGLGEQTEDRNHNGFLDPGEDTNGNGVLDWVDKPTETEDINGNGALDAGEDDGVIGADGNLTGAGNGQIDSHDRNNDGIITAYRNGVWDGSLDIFISFGAANLSDTVGDMPHLLINDPTNANPGYYIDDTSRRFGDALTSSPNSGCDAGDIDLDGDMDIIVAQLVGGNTRYVKVWRNDIGKIENKYYRLGFFKDISYEVPFVIGNSAFSETVEVEGQANVVAPVTGDNPYSVVGFANDVKLADIDGDGDLDMHISCIGNPQSQSSVGALNVVMMNRVVGDGWNAKGGAHPLIASSPRVTGISPRGAVRGEIREISVYGYNFKDGVSVDFGPGVTVMSVERIDEMNATVKVKIASTATIGPRKITIQNPTGGSTATKSGMFNVYDSGIFDPIYKNAVPAADWALLK